MKALPKSYLRITSIRPVKGLDWATALAGVADGELTCVCFTLTILRGDTNL